MNEHAVDWMSELALHYEQMRRAYPDDTLCVVFDIDGTILDMRHMVVRALLEFDRAHGTEHFRGLREDDVSVHENRIEDFLTTRRLPAGVRSDVAAWFAARLWTPEVVLAGSRPYRGVLSVIRWFELQPRTVVALNTGRPEALRDLTLQSLNAVARAHRVSFRSELLCMNPHGWREGVVQSKVAGIRSLQAQGLKVVAVVDNEPANLVSMAEADVTHEMLFLHADTIFESQRDDRGRSVAGNRYALAELVRESDLRARVEFIWHGVNDEANLRHFLSSDVRWAECDVRIDPVDRLVLRHDSFEKTPWSRSEHPFLLEGCLERVHQGGRAVALDLKEGGRAIDRVLEAVERVGLCETDVAFMGCVEDVGEEGVQRIRSRFPDAEIAMPVDFLAPLMNAAPSLGDQVLDELRRWGVTALSLAWTTAGIRTLLDELDGRGWGVNVFGVEDLEAFLEAALLLPRAVIADFNFPAWHYYGRGSGQRLAYHRYELVRAGGDAAI
ncbi:MAG: HAD family hydrolase [Actinomycetota bacterium]|nr:HAD family hydrolase [Actinomycetota bacterium]